MKVGVSVGGRFTVIKYKIKGRKNMKAAGREDDDFFFIKKILYPIIIQICLSLITLNFSVHLF